jgi:hypothetical protein
VFTRWDPRINVLEDYGGDKIDPPATKEFFIIKHNARFYSLVWDGATVRLYDVAKRLPNGTLVQSMTTDLVRIYEGLACRLELEKEYVAASCNIAKNDGKAVSLPRRWSDSAEELQQEVDGGPVWCFLSFVFCFRSRASSSSVCTTLYLAPVTAGQPRCTGPTPSSVLLNGIRPVPYP